MSEDTAVFEKPVHLEEDLSSAIDWIGVLPFCVRVCLCVAWLSVRGERTAEEVRHERERVMCGIERMALIMGQRGDREVWYQLFSFAPSCSRIYVRGCITEATGG